MYVIIAGAGEVGSRIAEKLLEENHDVILIDNDEEICEKRSLDTGAKVVCGDASKIEVLENARIDKADVCLGAIGDDSANLAFTILASSRNVPRILARARDPSYEDAYLEAGADRAINTVDIYMDTFLLEIEHPSIDWVADLGAGEASIVIIEIPDDSPIQNLTINNISSKEEFPDNCVFAGIYREGEFTVPRGQERIFSNDQVFLSGDFDSIRDAAEVLGI